MKCAASRGDSRPDANVEGVALARRRFAVGEARVLAHGVSSNVQSFRRARDRDRRRGRTPFRLRDRSVAGGVHASVGERAIRRAIGRACGRRPHACSDADTVRLLSAVAATARVSATVLAIHAARDLRGGRRDALADAATAVLLSAQPASRLSGHRLPRAGFRTEPRHGPGVGATLRAIARTTDRLTRFRCAAGRPGGAPPRLHVA